MLQETADGLYCPAGNFYIDPWGTVERAVITHAHGDHARAGSHAYLCAAPCGALLERRLEPGTTIETVPYNHALRVGSVTISFHPAGHILGSAQVRVEGEGGVWVVSGDYKREADPTCEPFEPVRCDTFITESTFGLPVFRWDPARQVIADLHRWWENNRAGGLASILFCYTLGKAQRILAALAELTDRSVLLHGALATMTDVYRRAGIPMLTTEVLVDRARRASMAGELILAPLSARGTRWMRRLGDFSDACASGTMRVRGIRRQRNVDGRSSHTPWMPSSSTHSRGAANGPAC